MEKWKKKKINFFFKFVKKNDTYLYVMIIIQNKWRANNKEASTGKGKGIKLRYTSQSLRMNKKKVFTLS